MGVIVAIIVVFIVYFLSYLVRIGNFNKEMEFYQNNEITLNKKLDKVLVVYYSNSGNTKLIAELIAKKLNGVIYDIKTGFPKPNTSYYSHIFIGSPVHGYTTPRMLKEYLKNNFFVDKNVYPFNTNMGNNGKFFKNFKLYINGANVGKEASFYNVKKWDEKTLDNKINDWLNNL
ncbi:MAG: hypothetical protein Ta2D_06790 [Rickettsiales bacterium]|nr:MAG: hypothetical protein Ta2D_06790 [Rickettsiales bacterium]